MGDNTATYAVERAYMRVLHEIDKAIIDGDLDRAKAMVRRGAVGDPRVLPRLQINKPCDNPPAKAA
jgi:hypothetical protein